MRKRLIYRCDDVGYTPVYDQGLFDVIDAGIGCSADVMLDSMDAAESLKKLKERPWVSVGWHRHLWERPVLPPSEVPSLVDKNGRFKWGHRKNHLRAQATYEDAYKEFEAQLALCYANLGRYPDVAGAPREDNELERAFSDICEKYKLVTGYFSATFPRQQKVGESDAEYQKSKAASMITAEPAWADKNIISLPISVGGSYDLKNFCNYEPLVPMTNVHWSEKEEIFFYGWHPGFLDDHIFSESTSSIHRVKEYVVALSDEYRSWIIQNKVELINFRDALYGTNEFQDHLKEIGSPLYLGNM